MSETGTSVEAEFGELAIQHLQALLRIDTTNPPGNETAAAEYLAEVLRKEGIEPTLVGVSADRKNVLARLKGGDGSKGPLLLCAHLDVVPVELEHWTHPPFGGVIADGFLWGRGAIDMKHMAVMSVLTLIRLKREGYKLDRDVIFAGVADEEAGCEQGSKWLVVNHPDLVRAEFALGEAGAFSVYSNGVELYPIQVAEKGVVWFRMKARGTPGHGSMPREDNAVGRLSRAVAALASTRLPHHRTPVVEAYLGALAATQPAPRSWLIRNLWTRAIANLVLGKMPDRGVANAIAAALSNTAVPTMLRAGQKVNVIPGEAEAEVDGRTLPGQTTADFLREVQQVVGEEIELAVTRELPPVETSPESQLFDVLKATLKQHAPAGTAIPYMAPGFTDAKSWAELGCRCYGFEPVRFSPDDPKFSELFHGHNERIPIAGLKWGTTVLFEAVRRFVVPTPTP